MKVNIFTLAIFIPVVVLCRYADDDPFNRIIKGTDAQLGEFPWQASFRKYGVHTCGAIVIGSEWALTAAHCTEKWNTVEMQIITGRLSKKNVEPTEQIANVEAYFQHENFSKDTFANDISLLKLEHPLDLSTPYTKAAELPTTQNQESHGYCNITGWGYITPDGGYPELLQKISIPVLSNEICQRQYRHKIIEDHMICAWSSGQDACEGDSGGPMICANAEDSSNYLAGITSWGIGCASSRYPGVYTRVSYFLDWIENIIASNEKLKS